MIDLYTWETSNGRKASVMLEECGLEYRVFAVDIDHGGQHDPAYRAILPAGKIPAIVDHDFLLADGSGPHLIFESGAILLYLANKVHRFLPADGGARSECMQWFMFGLSTLGPLLQQLHYFNRRGGEPVQVAVERYAGEAARLYGVLEQRLANVAYLGGSEYTIADIATYPWIARHEWQKITLADFPNVRRWYDTVGARAAVRRGFAVPKR
jgi:GST-like protein